MAWSDYHLPARSVVDDPPGPGDDLRPWKWHPDQMEALRLAYNQRVRAFRFGGYLDVITSFPGFSGAGKYPFAQTSVNLVRSRLNERILSRSGYQGHGSGNGWWKGTGFIDIASHATGSLEGVAVWGGASSPPATYLYAGLAQLLTALGLGNGSYWTNVPSRNSWGISAAYATSEVLGRVPGFMEHANEPKTAMEAMKFSTSPDLPTYSAGGGGSTNVSYNGDFRTWPLSTDVTQIRVFAALSPTVTWTSSTITADGNLHLIATISPGTNYTGGTIATTAGTADGTVQLVFDLDTSIP